MTRCPRSPTATSSFDGRLLSRANAERSESADRWVAHECREPSPLDRSAAGLHRPRPLSEVRARARGEWGCATVLLAPRTCGVAASGNERTSSRPDRRSPRPLSPESGRSGHPVALFFRVVGVRAFQPALRLLPGDPLTRQHPTETFPANPLRKKTLLVREGRQSAGCPDGFGKTVRLRRLTQQRQKSGQGVWRDLLFQTLRTGWLSGTQCLQAFAVEKAKYPTNALRVPTEGFGDGLGGLSFRRGPKDLAMACPNTVGRPETVFDAGRFLFCQRSREERHEPSLLESRRLNNHCAFQH